MNSAHRVCLALLAAAAATLLVAGCSHTPDAAEPYAPVATPRGADHKPKPAKPGTTPEGARLSTDEVLRIAEQIVIHKGFDPRDFMRPVAYYEFLLKDRTWTVFYDGRVVKPSKQCVVTVDDQTGATQFSGGK